jgi:exopolyphosphatase/pppGpp-phosphohydrolase
LGAEPQLLSGEAEAETVFCGAAGGQPATEYCACIDIGGWDS